MKRYKSFWTGEVTYRLSEEEYNELRGKKEKQEEPVRSNMPKVEILRNDKGEVYAYRVNGVTSTEPPMGICASGTVIW